MLCLHSEEPGCNGHAKSLFNTAAEEGKLDVLKWGEDYRYKLKKILGRNTIPIAALYGHLEVVKYLRQLDIYWDELTCVFAAGIGHLEMLKWAGANQCPWDEYTCAKAAGSGHLELLK